MWINVKLLSRFYLSMLDNIECTLWFTWALIFFITVYVNNVSTAICNRCDKQMTKNPRGHLLISSSPQVSHIPRLQQAVLLMRGFHRFRIWTLGSLVRNIVPNLSTYKILEKQVSPIFASNSHKLSYDDTSLKLK